MKKKNLTFILSVIITILILSPTIQVKAILTWEDDFEDGNLDDWLFNAWEINSEIYNPPIDPGFNIIDGILRAPNYPYFNDTSRNMTSALHNSTFAYGIWNFDWVPQVSLTEEAFFDIVAIIYNINHQLDLTGLSVLDKSAYGYTIRIYHNSTGVATRISLTKRVGPPPSTTTLGSYDLTPAVMESIHIEVTRDKKGHFNVYYDTALIIEATDNDITTSDHFVFRSYVGDTGLDNITINDALSSNGSIPASTVGFVIWMMTPTLIVLYIVRKRIIFKNRGQK